MKFYSFNEFPVPYGFCSNEKDWHRELNKYNMHEPYPYNRACTTKFKKNNNTFIIVTFDNSIDDENFTSLMGLVVHESVHVFQYICKDIGEERPSIEFEAYSIQRISMNIFDAYNDSRLFYEFPTL